MATEITKIDDRQISKDFFNKYIGAKGPVGVISRYISNTGYWYADMIIKESQMKETDLVLDIGCGSATTIINVLKRFDLKNPIQGIEPSDAQYALAKKNIAEAGLDNKLNIRQGCASPLPFDDDSIDIVYASFIYKHFSDESLSQSLKEAYRVLKPGGIFMTWEFARITKFLFKRIVKDPKKAMQHLRGFEELKVLAEQAGFKKIEEINVRARGFWDPAEHAGLKATK